jgi:ParB family chromosome partitioning protein
MSKKPYALPQGITAEISNTVDLVKNNMGTLNYKIVPINAIEFDPDNPRELSIQRDELPLGPKQGDPLFDKKMRELESLKQTAETIKKYGVRNAVEIYKYGTTYRLIHGERRCLSSILAGKKEIPAKILDEKPTDFDIRLLQLIENVQREDLNLYETLNNIRQVITEYKRNVNQDKKIDAAFLEELINKSRSHCFNYLAVLNAPSAIQDAIKLGQIKSIEKAALIANSSNQKQQKTLLESCLRGASLKKLKNEAKVLKQVENSRTHFIPPTKTKPGKKAEKINMGSTQNKAIIAKIAKLVSSDSNYLQFIDHFNKMKFDNFSECADSFKSLMLLMNKVEAM